MSIPFYKANYATKKRIYTSKTKFNLKYVEFFNHNIKIRIFITWKLFFFFNLEAHPTKPVNFLQRHIFNFKSRYKLINRKKGKIKIQHTQVKHQSSQEKQLWKINKIQYDAHIQKAKSIIRHKLPLYDLNSHKI